MSEDFISSKEKVSFREIVLAHLKKILEISTSEFRGGYTKIVYSGNTSHKEYVPNSRKCYIQSIEALSDVLIAYFDKEMKKAEEDYNKKNETLKKEKEGKKSTKNLKINYQNKRVKLARKLFQELNLLLNRKQYLKAMVYAEEDDDE